MFFKYNLWEKILTYPQYMRERWDESKESTAAPPLTLHVLKPVTWFQLLKRELRAVRKSQIPITDFVKRAYFVYFSISIRNHDNPWVRHIVCSVCTTGLRKWTKLKGAKMKFAIPVIWREPTNHVDDCYFCVISLSGKEKSNAAQCHILIWPLLLVRGRTVTTSRCLYLHNFCQRTRSHRKISRR